MQNFSEHSSAGARVWYKAAPVNLIAEHSTTEILSEVKFTVKDFNLTKLSYLKNPQNFNVWYNDGAEFFAYVCVFRLHFDYGCVGKLVRECNKSTDSWSMPLVL